MCIENQNYYKEQWNLSPKSSYKFFFVCEIKDSKEKKAYKNIFEIWKFIWQSKRI